jgi:replicative DNA helicase
VRELRLTSGRVATVADDHRVLTREGWRPVGALGMGARIAAPRVVPDPVDPSWWPDDEVVLLAHLLAEPDAVARRPLCYQSSVVANVDAVEKAVAHFGIVARRVRHGDWWRVYLPAPAGLPKGERHPVTAWLTSLGASISLPSEDAACGLPEGVFALERRQLALFVRHLWAAGGVLRLGEGGNAVISYRAPSRRLADDLQAALVRFGIATRIRATAGADPAVLLLVQGAEAQYRFIDEIGAHSGGGAEAQRVARFLAASADPFERRTPPPVQWDVVAGMQSLGDQAVCDASLAGSGAAAAGERALLAGGIAVATR